MASNKAAKKVTSKREQAQTSRNTSAITKASKLDLNSALGALSTAGVTIQSQLGQISENLILKHEELKAVDTAIELKKKEMADLHGADQILLSIDELHAQHLAEMEELENAKKDAQDLMVAEATREQHERGRERTEYGYNLALARKKEQDVWENVIYQRNNEERNRQEALGKDWSTRENVLKDKEKAYTDALAKVTTFDEEVRKVSEKEKAIALASLRKDYEHQTELLKVNHAAELTKLSFDNKRLVETANNLEAQVASLQVQLRAAYESNSILAGKALEAANNKQAQADALALMTNIGGNGAGARPRG